VKGNQQPDVSTTNRAPASHRRAPNMRFSIGGGGEMSRRSRELRASGCEPGTPSLSIPPSGGFRGRLLPCPNPSPVSWLHSR